MSLLVGVKCTGLRQTCTELRREHAAQGKQLRGFCVHSVGSMSHAKLTPLRREAIRKAHNSKMCGRSGRCSLHVATWKTKLKSKFCLSAAAPEPRRTNRTRQAPVVQAHVVQEPAAREGPRSQQDFIREAQGALDDSQAVLSDQLYLQLSNVYRSLFHLANPAP